YGRRRWRYKVRTTCTRDGRTLPTLDVTVPLHCGPCTESGTHARPASRGTSSGTSARDGDYSACMLTRLRAHSYLDLRCGPRPARGLALHPRSSASQI